MRVTFFCFAKRKSPKKRRPPVCDPFALRRGKPAAGRLRGAPWNSLRCVAASFRHPRRVSARGMGAPTPMLTPQRPRRRRSQQGWDSRTSKHPNNRTAGHPFGPSLRSAAPAQRVALAPARWGRAQRSEAMARGAVWMFGCPTPAGCACGGAVVGWHARRSARASCSDSPWMSERRAAAQSEFHGAPRNRPDAGVPRSEAQGSQTGGRLFFGDFLLAKQKKVTRTPGDSRPPPSTQASSPISPTTRYYKINSYQPISH